MAPLDILIVVSFGHSESTLTVPLRGLGHRLREVGSPVAGVQAASERMPDLLILDRWPLTPASVGMLEHLRRMIGNAELPILVFTSTVAPQYAHRARFAQRAIRLPAGCTVEAVMAEIGTLFPVSEEAGTLTGHEPAPVP